MPAGLIVLIAVSALIFLGLAHRVLDRLRLSDGAALAVIAAIIIGSFIPDIPITDRVSVNIGGAIVPVALAVYLFIKAGTAKEKVRAIIASLGTGAAVYALGKLLPAGPEDTGQFMDYNYLYAAIGGLTAYLLGRSRRSAFIAGIMGIVLSDLVQGLINWYTGMPGQTSFGGAGAFDVTIISGVFAVVLAELIGESRERMQGGTADKDMEFEGGEFVDSKDTAEESGEGRNNE
jgi:uncharacterized membrane protein